MVKWEYTEVRCNVEAPMAPIEVLNQMGEQGWELFSASYVQQTTAGRIAGMQPTVRLLFCGLFKRHRMPTYANGIVAPTSPVIAQQVEDTCG